MTIWRYMAIDMGRAGREALASRRTGELAAESAAEVRASLRRIGLQVIDLKPLSRPRKMGLEAKADVSSFVLDFMTQRLFDGVLEGSVRSFRGHFRRRRCMERAELYDSLATMLESGVPLLEAVSTLAQNSGRKRSMRSMLLHVHEGLRSGDSLASAVSRHEGWFDPVEVAMIRAGQHGGTLPSVLRTLADRQERSSALAQKLTGALAYPAKGQGRGGIAHQHLAAWIAEVGRRRGHQAHTEWIVPGTNHPVDVVWQDGNSCEVFECVITAEANLASHIRACFVESSSVTSLTLVFLQKRIRDRIQRKLAGDASVQPYADRIRLEVVETFMKELWP
jgi:hypothetical protein